MSTDHINPHHPVTRALEDQWHKLCAAAMRKLGSNQVTLDVKDFEAISGKVIVARVKNNQIILTLTGEDVGRSIAEHHMRTEGPAS